MKPRYEIIPDEYYQGITTCRVCIAKGTYKHVAHARSPEEVEDWLLDEGVLAKPDEDNDVEGEGV